MTTCTQFGTLNMGPWERHARSQTTQGQPEQQKSLTKNVEGAGATRSGVGSGTSAALPRPGTLRPAPIIEGKELYFVPIEYGPKMVFDLLEEEDIDEAVRHTQRSPEGERIAQTSSSTVDARRSSSGGLSSLGNVLPVSSCAGLSSLGTSGGRQCTRLWLMVNKIRAPLPLVVNHG